MDEDSEISKLEESLEGPFLLRVEQPIDVEKTFIAPSKTLSQPLSDDEEEVSLDSLDFNFTSCGETIGRRSIIGLLNHNHNLTTIAADYASISLDEESEEAEDEGAGKEPSSERVSDNFDPYDFMVTKQMFNFKDLTPKQVTTTMNKLGTRLETCKNMYPTMIKDNVMKNLRILEAKIESRIQSLEDERRKPLSPVEDEENDLLLKIIQQLEHKVDTLNEKLQTVSNSLQ